MSAIDRLLDDYEAVAEAASRLLGNKDHHEGEREPRCERGRCLKCDEAYIQAEADLHRALAKVAPHPFRSGARNELHSESGPRAQQEIMNVPSGPAEYLRSFFFELERLKRRSSCDVSHAMGFRDGKLHILMSIGDFRERVYVQDLDQDPASAAQDVFLLWRTTPRIDEEIE
jgi:hypothetical protein